MVVNTLRRFLFVHIPKAAGTSLAAVLSSLEGNRTGWLPQTKHKTLAAFQVAVSARTTHRDR